MQLFPERIINLWNKCEVRVIILLSLVLQIILVIFSNRRKLTNRVWIKIIVWSAYLSADWVATVALGNLASTIRDSQDKTPVPNNTLQEFWAPFLLLHLGGPDTITAYSLEDNELWLRHFLGLIIQVGVAIYIFLRSWGNTALTFLTIPIFISGVIKYGERTYALMSSSSEHFKDSLPSSPDSCQDFVKYVDGRDTRGKRAEEEEAAMVIPRGKRVEGGSSEEEEARVIPRGKRAEGGTSSEEEARVISRGKRAEGGSSSSEEASVISGGKGEEGESSEEEEARVIPIPQDGIHKEDHYLVLAYFLFNRTKFFFAERTLNKDERDSIYSIIKNMPNAKEAFKLVEVELGLMYDVLYTKAAIVYSQLGIVLRCITFFCSVSVLVVFSTIIDTHFYPLTDVSLSYLLLVMAVLLELYALLVLFLSNWTKLWLIKFQNSQHNSLSKSRDNLFWRLFSHSQSLVMSTKRWSESIGQYNILCSCLKKVQPACIEVLNLPFIGKLLENEYLTSADVNMDLLLQEKILECLKQYGRTVYVNDNDLTFVRRDLILHQRGNYVLHNGYEFDKLTSEWCTINLEFVDSIIVWHIATDICYCGDLDDDVDSKISKCLSNYMLYLLVFRPSMLPVGIGEIRLKETNDEIIRLLKKNKLHDTPDKSKACEALRQNYSDLLQNFSNMLQNDEKNADDFSEFFKGESQSLLKCGLMVSTQLQNKQRKREIISDVWVEILLYAAHNCGWQQHAQQLTKGGELLTHVCRLMAHFGFTKQYVSTHLFGFTPDMGKEGVNKYDLISVGME